MSLTQEHILCNEQIIRVVKEFKARPVLWDPNHDLYRVQTSRYEAWGEIAAKINYNVMDLKRKFKSIFASHRRERSRVLRGIKTHWFLYDLLSFLPTHVKNLKASKKRNSSAQKTLNTYKQVDENVDGIDDQDNDDNTDHSDEETEFIQKEIIVKNEPEDEPPPKRVLHYRKPRAVRSTRPSFKRHFLTRERDRSLTEPYVKPLPTKGKDECDSFGEYIAVSLRKHDERTRSMIKQAINNILFEQEMKKYNSTSFVVEKNPLIIGDSDDCEK
ncbi:uncharacterized protein LOC110999135 isoform X1 [Pieris rapae]|uniref:uncharacterized protein LOC110999135 isoform X1 n=1 Tax=Pieris rapae TaxID=64459 RepID=UPI000B928926|nr:uncharacterized protein LOC110999135 isoform X1 [Pieris rapae]